MTRAEWALACKALVEGFAGTRLRSRSPLKDLGGVDPAVAEAAELLVGEGWMAAESGRFRPQATVSREEAARTLARLIGLATPS